MNNLELSIHLFATLKDRAGQNAIDLSVPAPATVQDVLDAVNLAYPQLSASLPTVLVAVNKEFAFPNTAIAEGDEIALFPPVSGGERNLPHPTYFAISSAAPDIAAIYRLLAQPSTGAIVSFTGLVRGQTARKGMPAETLYLEYEAYNSMAEDKMAQIAREIWQQWPKVQGIAIVQRIGKLDISDVTTFVACASGHRDQGSFEAARYGIDRLKEIVPVWKKEVGQDQSKWIEGYYKPTPNDTL
ncbi:MAG: molybdenum cofactor biosynthesis protein MoaE [Candidatus Promineifilaceae bacterium]|nr:molybdenum cofactor biosynthesis protein MoaE [Candidatus Promineifilaceae bacterium]